MEDKCVRAIDTMKSMIKLLEAGDHDISQTSRQWVNADTYKFSIEIKGKLKINTEDT